MEVEIIFSGLCTFLNIPDKENKTDDKIVEPSVILVQTENCGAIDCAAVHDSTPREEKGGHMPGGGDHDDDDAATDEEIEHEADSADNGKGNGGHVPGRSHRHIPFIAFDTEQVTVDNATGFSPVPDAPSFLYMPLDGVELTIEHNGKPKLLTVDESYRTKVAKREDYWPASKGMYNPAYVPARGQKPSKAAVKAFFRLSGGTIGAGNMSRAAWAFLDGDQVTLCGLFSEEIVYSDFPVMDNKVVIKLTDLENEKNIIRVLRFSPKKPGGTVSLAIGNHVLEEIDNAVRREPFEAFVPKVAGAHWTFLNQICTLPGPGPVPRPLPIPFPKRRGVGGGGPTGGPCGPVHG